MANENAISGYIFYISLSIIILGSIASYALIGGLNPTGAVTYDRDETGDGSILEGTNIRQNSFNGILGSIIVGILFFASILCVSHISVGIYGRNSMSSGHNSKYISVVVNKQKNNKLASYVKQCMSHGMAEKDIVSKCTSVGWKLEEVREAFKRL